MGDSTSSFMDDSLGYEESTAPSEESSWTSYLADFAASQMKETASASCSLSITPASSMVSDANSSVAWKPPSHVESLKECKKLSFKRRKARRGIDDDPLEDTASSPVNSPKVPDLDGLDTSPRETENNRRIPQEKGAGCVNYGEPESDGIDGKSFSDKRNECTELRKRGLCLVPLSMLIDYV